MKIILFFLISSLAWANYDVADAVKRLNSTSKTVVSEKASLLKKIEEQKLAQLLAQEKATALATELSLLKKNNDALESEQSQADYMLEELAVLSESFPAFMGKGEGKTFSPQAMIDSFISDETKVGAVYDGSGQSFEGMIHRCGALNWFENSERSGLCFEQGGTLLLRDNVENISWKNVLSQQQQFPLFFNTKAALHDREESLIDHLKKGKIAIIPLLILALFATVVAIIRLIALTGVVSKQHQPEIDAIVTTLEKDGEVAALALTKKLPRPMAQVIASGIEHANLSKEHLEEILYERITISIPRLEKGLTMLAVSASAAPLLGLLGTVTGMIHTFQMITEYGGGNSTILSSGISEALVTTEVGLVVAIPALLLHSWFSRKVSKAISLTQKSAIIFVNRLKVK